MAKRWYRDPSITTITWVVYLPHGMPAWPGSSLGMWKSQSWILLLSRKLCGILSLGPCLPCLTCLPRNAQTLQAPQSKPELPSPLSKPPPLLPSSRCVAGCSGCLVCAPHSVVYCISLGLFTNTVTSKCIPVLWGGWGWCVGTRISLFSHYIKILLWWDTRGGGWGACL